jgi:phenylalanyl-tRNA synthetase alpha chain
MVERIAAIKDEAVEMINDIRDLKQLEEVKIRYLGRKGLVTELIKYLGNLPKEERPHFGQKVNEAKLELEELLKKKQNSLKEAEKEKKIKEEKIDISFPGTPLPQGKSHVLTQTMDEIVDIFSRMGFAIAYGPDVETDYYNFEALNIPQHHPSRDMWSTLYINEKLLLRTHTSPVQIRVMEKEKPPLAVIVPGKVYRRDADVTHSTVFHQVEGLLVDKNVTFGQLKGTLISFLQAIFGKHRRVRFRPSFFPFTEPSAEVDVECIMCNGKGCRVCSHTGWLEILGAGMVDPNVFTHVNYDTTIYSGFAFGLGVERIAMLKYGIGDIRLFYENDLRFLRQF